MSPPTTGTLQPLGTTDRTVADPEADVRGRAVVARDGRRMGRVDDLLIDAQADQVLFLRVAEGGFLGFGARHSLVPVQAVVAVHRNRVEVDPGRGARGDVPGYDPELAPVPACYGNVYGWWGLAPFWGAYPR